MFGILGAVLLNRNDLLKWHLEQGDNVNVRNGNNLDTPLHLAVQKKSKESIKILLANGADVSAKNRFYKTPLDIAIDHGSNEIVEILLKYGAKQSLKKFTFNEALKTENVTFIKFFLDNGSNVEAALESGQIPLHYAIDYRFEAVAHLLLDYGADANSKDMLGSTALEKAVKYHASTKLVDHLLEKGATLNAKDKNGLTPLSIAVQKRNLNLVRLFLDKNPDLEDKENKFAFSLSFLDRYFNANAVAIFVERGFTLAVEDFNDFEPNKVLFVMEDKFEDEKFRITVQDTLNRTAATLEEFHKLFFFYEVLRGSIKNGCIDIVNNLLTSTLNVNIPFPDGYTMLHTAVINGHLPVVEKLLTSGADVNALDESNKMSALHFSIEDRQEEIATVLLKNNANTEVRDERNGSPLELAFSMEVYKIVLLLLDAGANIKSHNRVECNYFVFEYLNNLNVIKALSYFGVVVEHQRFLNLFLYRCPKDRLNSMKLLFNHIEACSSDSSAVLHSKDYKHLGSKGKRLLIKYIAFQGSSIDYDSSESKWCDFQTKCQEEIAKMKLTEIEGFSISVDDVLRKKSQQIARYLNNKDFVQGLEEMDFKTKFPLYWSKIKTHVKKGEVTKRLLELSSVYLEDVLNLNLPMLVKDKIFSYFDDQDLRRLIFLSSIDEVKKASLRYKEEDVVDVDDDDDVEDDDDEEDVEDDYDDWYNNCYNDYDGYGSDSDFGW